MRLARQGIAAGRRELPGWRLACCVPQVCLTLPPTAPLAQCELLPRDDALGADSKARTQFQHQALQHS